MSTMDEKFESIVLLREDGDIFAEVKMKKSVMDTIRAEAAEENMSAEDFIHRALKEKLEEMEELE